MGYLLKSFFKKIAQNVCRFKKYDYLCNRVWRNARPKERFMRQ